MKIKLIYLTILVLLLSGCEKIITDIELNENDPHIVLNGYISYNQPIYTNLTSSWSPLIMDTLIFIEDATVEVLDDDKIVQSLYFSREGNFLSKLNNLHENKEYLLRATAPGYENAICRFTIPEIVNIVSLDSSLITKSRTDEYGTYKWRQYRFGITINDPVEVDNYYIVKLYIDRSDMKAYDSPHDTVLMPFLPCHNFIITEDIEAEFGIFSYKSWVRVNEDNYVEGMAGICYSDVLFNGEKHTFNIDISEYDVLVEEEGGRNTIYAIVENISKEYYLLLKSINLYESTEDNPLSHEVNIFSNVEGGLGIVCTLNASVDSMIVTKMFQPNFNRIFTP